MAHSTCTEPDCSKPTQARGVCGMHYRRMRIAAGGNLPPIPRMNEKHCSVEGCEQMARKRGMCANDYSRFRRFGDTERRVSAWRKPGAPCLWCGGAVPGERGRSNYCSVSCNLLKSQNRKLGVNKRASGYACERCGDVVELPARTDGARLRRADGKMCDPCRRARRHTRHHMSPHRLVRRDGPNCQICMTAVDMSLKFPHPMSATVDHVIPWARGGSHDPDNLQLAHYSCNCRKQATLPAGVKPAV